MPERDPHDRSTRPPEAASTPWDLPALAAALGTTPEPAQDLLFGAGTAFRLGSERTTYLALYPEHGAVELTTPDLVVSVRRPAAARPLEGGVLVEAQSRRTRVSLTVDAAGGISLLSDPLPAAPPSPGLVAELARHGIAVPAELRPQKRPDDHQSSSAGEGGE
jgi:hypothetical protein